MKKIVSLIIGIFMFCATTSAHALLVDITDSTLTHFGDFPHVNTPGDYSNISKDFTIDGNGGDFGWHYSPSNHGSAIGGILLDQSYAATSLSFEIHQNPFKDFLLQGSADTTTGFDGNWDTILSSTVTERTELAVQSWDFENSTVYSAYRINIFNDYTTNPYQGWAMYRWKLLADENTNAVPEPATLVLMGIGLTGMALRRRRI